MGLRLHLGAWKYRSRRLGEPTLPGLEHLRQRLRGAALGRNLSIEVLEYLDSAGYTRRAGALRRVRKISMEEKRPRWGARTSNPDRGV